jgi:hypothetical protein
MTPTRRPEPDSQNDDPFELGDVRGSSDELDPAVVTAVEQILSAVTTPTNLSELLGRMDHFGELDHLDATQRHQLPWALAVVVASAYGSTDLAEHDAPPSLFDDTRLAVVRSGTTFNDGHISGDDLLVIPRTSDNATYGESLWTASTQEG